MNYRVPFAVMLKATILFALLFAQSSMAMDGDARYSFLGYSLAFPPENGSPVDLSDEATLRFFQANRTEAQCARAEYENTIDLNNMYGPETGVLTAEEVKESDSDAQAIINKVGLITGEFKIRFERPRPYNDYPGLSPCITKPFDSTFGMRMSYPSSYASISTVLEAFLTKRYPKKSALIKKQSKQLCTDRVLGGVHHPSDIEAGLDLGQQIIERDGY